MRSCVGLVFKRRHARAAEAARRVVDACVKRGVRVLLTEEQQQELGVGDGAAEEVIVREIDFVVCLGGDGTLLHAAGIVSEGAVPVLGVNMGRLGFLTPFPEEELESALAAALNGELEIQERMRLRVTLRRPDEADVTSIAANDAVITQGALARLLSMEAWADGSLITTYQADGLIVSTPTGSTAYNLSAGGPLMTPGLEAICLTPICPHTLSNRSLVLPADSVITVHVGETADQALLTIDGQRGYAFGAGDEIRVARAERPLPLFAAPGRDIFTTLRSKLRWGGGLP